VKIHRRAVLLTAEAGYGKTTLLADFTRRTRLRVLWFRLDRGDRDWTSFIAHLVASIRIHVPDFGASTRSLLRQTAATAPTLEEVFETLIKELRGVSLDATAIVFDDFHLVDDSQDVRNIVRDLLTQAPDRVSFVFASRREPPVRLARLRALDEVAELGTDDLRFDARETEKLFRETYEMQIDSSVLDELGRRTEGWAASLQLVRAALHDRNPTQVRAFVSSLSGAEGHLYEYLAEEVVGELPEELQDFLMRTSVLDVVELRLGPIAAGVPVDRAARLIEESERHGLLARGGPRARHVVRAHPLVRDFLYERLRRSVPLAAVVDIHRRVAEESEHFDWRTAARHFLSAGARSRAELVLSRALEEILATGAYTAAGEFVDQFPNGLAGTPGLVLKSRLALQRGDRSESLVLAETAWTSDPTSTAAILSLITARHFSGDVAGALEASRRLDAGAESTLASIARAYEHTMASSVGGSMDRAAKTLRSLAETLRRESRDHFLGVTLLNLALVEVARGSIEEALQWSDEAVELLGKTSAGVELVAARLARAQSLGLLGRMEEARGEMELAKSGARAGQLLELAADIGWIESMLGDGTRVRDYVEEITSGAKIVEDGAEEALFARALVRISDGNIDAADADLQVLRFGAPATNLAFEVQRHFLVAVVRALQDSEDAEPAARRGLGLARQQGASLWADYGELLLALVQANAKSSSSVVAMVGRRPVVLSMLAEVVVHNLAHLSPEALALVTAEAEARPWRWRKAIRRATTSRNGEVRIRSARLLERIGEPMDVRPLRNVGRQFGGRTDAMLGYALARRLAPRVVVEDLGRVRIVTGTRVTDGQPVRRKVLGLLCLLLTRQRYTLARDEVIDSLWPDHDPASAVNSLNQTVYFLRRVFEPEYGEETSPGYVGQDGETIWLDPELVDCTSRKCLELIRSMPKQPSPAEVLQLSTLYTGRFALDFAYEEWASAYRDSLHAAYLRVIEQAIRLDIDSGHVDRGLLIAERAAEVDPESEEIQLALARLYRQSGAHAAAAEVYARYTRTMNDLGVEPAPLTERT
jgi:LuxR family maltose regulon positive regulatory protein